jgi:hypothetical protein
MEIETSAFRGLKNALFFSISIWDLMIGTLAVWSAL